MIGLGGGLGGAAGSAAAAAAGLPYPEGDPEGLRGAARALGAAASMITERSAAVGSSAVGVITWEGVGSESFHAAVAREQEVMQRGVGALERAAGAAAKLATTVEDAQEGVVELAGKVQEAKQEADRAQERAAALSLVAAGAGMALDAFGADPPRALVEAKHDGEDDAGKATGGAAAAREHAQEVYRRAREHARELCEDCRRADHAAAGEIEDVAAAAPQGGLLGGGLTPGARYKSGIAERMTVSDFQELSYLRAGIDPTAWNPEGGLDPNDEIVRKVYAYYERFGLERDEFEWMKMAALGGPMFYAGFKDIDTAGDTADDAGRVLGPLGGPLGAAFGALGGELSQDELRWNEGQFLRMQKGIFSDLAWQHEAFALGGLAAIRRAGAKEPASAPPVLDPRTLSAWEDIESGDPTRITDGNFKLIEREQDTVIGDLYDDMRERPTGNVFTLGQTRQADTPIPGSEPYLEHSHHDFFKGVPEGNISNYDDRIRWIRESLWPAHQELLGRPGAVEGLLRRDFDTEVERYRQVTPKEVAKDLAPPLIPPIRIPLPGLG